MCTSNYLKVTIRLLTNSAVPYGVSCSRQLRYRSRGLSAFPNGLVSFPTFELPFPATWHLRVGLLGPAPYHVGYPAHVADALRLQIPGLGVPRPGLLSYPPHGLCCSCLVTSEASISFPVVTLSLTTFRGCPVSLPLVVSLTDLSFLGAASSINVCTHL